MKNEEEGLYSQHIQINKLGERSNLVKEETLKIDQSNVEHSDQLADMENELAEMSAMLGLDMENSDLSEVEGIVALTEKELQSIEKMIFIPPLEVIQFKDWSSFVADSNAFLKNEGLDITSDPIFEMLSISEMNDVLQEYKDNYGEIFLDWKDYAVVLLAGATGALINQFAPDNLKKCKLISGEGGKQLLDESLGDWKEFAKDQISTQIGFDIDNLQNLKGLVIEKISSKIGFEPGKLKEIQEYLWEKKESGEGFTAIEDSLQIYQRLPSTWKMIADEWLTEKIGWTINEIILLQDFITKRIKSKKFKFPDDSIAIFQMLPQAWQEFGRDAILGRIGVELSDITEISNFIIEKISSGKINPFYDSVELIKILPENWKVALSSSISAKIGFDISVTEDIQEYLSERIQKNDFDLMRDGVEILHRFPEEWQNLINRTISEKGGFDIALTTDMQEYIAQKIREKNFNLLIDGIELLRRLPDEWQAFICQGISERIGFDITVLQNMQSHILDRIDKKEFDFLEDGVELLKRLPEDWKDFLNRIISEKVGFDITTTSEIQEFILEKTQEQKFDLFEDGMELLGRLPEEWQEFLKSEISAKIGFDIMVTLKLKGVQEYLWNKIKNGEAFTAIEDSLQLYQRLPTTWKMIANEWLTEKIGWTINEIILLQDFITKRIKSKKFKFPDDSIAIFQMLPQAWQEFGRDAILGRIGVELSDITEISNFIIEKISSGKINPFYDSVELIKILPENWKVAFSSSISAKIGFDISVTEDIQEYLSKRIKKNDFDLMRDGVEILHRFPEEWQSLINRTISEKGGFDIALTTDMQEYIVQKIREKNFNLLIDGIELLRRLPDEWQAFICQLISEKIGFDITVLQNMQSHILDRIDKKEFDFLADGVELLKRLPEDWKDFLNRIISEKVGFDITTTSEIQEFILEKTQEQKFDVFEDSMELLGRLPEEWQEFLKSEISAKIGFDIMVTLDIQTFLIKKIQERKFNLLEDSLVLIQKLPEEWKEVINRKISEKIGLDPKLINHCMNPNLAKLNRIRSKPFEFISQQIQTYIADNEQLNVLNKYLDLNRLSEVIVLVLDILKVILADEPEENHDQLGEHFQELLIIIIDILNPSKEQLLQIGGDVVFQKTGNFTFSAGTFEIDDWIANSGLNITIDELLDKLYSENEEDFRDEDLKNYAKLFSTIMEKSMGSEVLSDTMEQMFSSTSVMRGFLHD